MDLIENSLTNRQLLTLQTTIATIEGKPWSINHPVFIHDRSWLKLEELKVKDLNARLPPDCSQEAPELKKYRMLIKNGEDELIAVQACWKEFGIEDFHRALRKYWKQQDKGNNGWTFNKYLGLIKDYRDLISGSKISIPLIILARKDSNEEHKLNWIST